MSPEIWGKYGWDFFHLVTMGYPENPTPDDKTRYYNYVQDLQYVLPCRKCRTNLTQHLKNYPLTDKDLANRSNFVKWGIDLHNIVNYYIKKPVLTYAEATKKLEKLTQKQKKTICPVWYFLLAVFLILVVLILWFGVKKFSVNQNKIEL